MEDEDDGGNGINRRRVEKSVDISIGYVRSSVSTGKRRRRKKRQAEEVEATGKMRMPDTINVAFFFHAVALDLALSAKYSSFSRGNISYPTHSITFRFIDRCHLRDCMVACPLIKSGQMFALMSNDFPSSQCLNRHDVQITKHVMRFAFCNVY